MKSHGRWTGWLAFFYYTTGSVYYFYHWLLILGGVSLLASGFAWYLKSPLCAASLVSITLFLIVLGISFWRKIYKVRLCSHNPALKVERIAIDYSLIDNLNSDYVRHVTAKVLFPVQLYEARFNWTGQGKMIATPLMGTSNVEILDHSGSVFSICRVHFTDMLPKGMEHEFSYRVQFKDATKPVKPFLSHTVDAPIKELSLCVHLMPNQKVARYKRQVFISSMATFPLWEQEVEVSNPLDRRLDWVITAPKHHYFYRISWDE